LSACRDPWLAIDGGVRLRVRVTPKSSTETVLGLCETAEGTALQVKVRAVPENGAANSAVEKLIAGWLELPKSSVALRSGAKSRVKLLHVQGDSSTLVGRLRAELSKAGAD
jgi:uncharacterized protein